MARELKSIPPAMGKALTNATKVNLPCEPKMKSTHIMNPIPGDIPKDKVIICLRCIFPSLRGLDKSIYIQGSIESVIGHYLKLF